MSAHKPAPRTLPHTTPSSTQLRAAGVRSGASITIIMNNFTVSVNAILQATVCCLKDQQVEHKYKRPTFVVP
ncbi:hypothetical protein QL093DRAFT_2506805 [Fusarium oxysporum]|nr:Uncharacterized protein HZ326_18764 [Fusarium oxysporum f. sp. albedinis]KAJ9413897.1 hypothetical protein QL093DRAFT_2506805 [Fusarium oxysporum]